MLTPLSIYVHWPFCKSKCPYCDFNSHVREGVDHARWREALLAELRHWHGRTGAREVASIFFGGGTPSLMEAVTVEAVINEAAKLWSFAPDIEITLEANPTSVEAEKFKAFRSAGVNRVSLGVQSLRAEDLKFLGRQHNVQEALAAVRLARETFPRMSFDLIYALPGQSIGAWEAELKEALGFAADHLSLYQLTIEENTAFHHAYHSGAFVMPEDGPAADMYLLTQEIMERAGLPAYEVSNHAKPGAESRHNLAYWRGDEYIGIGPGAHGRVKVDGQWLTTEAIKSPERWLETAERKEAVLLPQERREEILMMGLRLTSGIDYADWQKRTGFDLRETLAMPSLKKLISQGLIEENDNRLRTTRRGGLLLNAVTSQLLAA